MDIHKIYKDFIVALILLIVGWYVHFPYINEFPAHIHAWAQTDRYAIALGFLNNGFNFFKPETFIYNHQFPNDWLVAGPATITSVDFPIHEYFIALIMKATGNQDPIVFRLYTLIYSLIGFFFLYKTSFLLSKDFFKSLLVMLFALFSPLLMYYQSGFLPTIPSLANIFIGLFFYTQYLISKKNTSFYWAIFFFTLAALNRTTFIIPLLALIGIEFLRVIFKDRPLKPWFYAVLCSFLVLGTYMWYNNYLRSIYGSEFLNYLLPAGSIAEAKELYWHVKARWKYVYFSWTQYELYAAVFAIGIVSFLVKFRSNLSRKPELLILFMAIVCLIGAFAFSAAMTRQFAHHDYYFIDTFYLPVVLSFLAAASFIPGADYRSVNAFWALLSLITIYPMMSDARDMQDIRRRPELWDRAHLTVEAFTGAEQFLNLHGVDKNAKLLVPDAIAPNLSFILARRKGYCVMETNSASLQKVKDWDFDYLLVEREFFPSHVYAHFPDLLQKISLVARNNRLLLFKKSAPAQLEPIDQLLGFDADSAFFQVHSDFSADPGSLWENIKIDSLIYFSAPSSAFVNQEMEFGLTYRFSAETLPVEKVEWVYFSAFFKVEVANDADMVLSVDRGDSLIFYRRTNLQPLITEADGWKQITHVYRFSDLQPGDKISFCIWNLGRGKYYYDDAVFRVFLK